ncbi:hypothetical protein N7471_013996 [Penicillium samsonianum]|uniref:uncharacterized protein n=1 Tax=Penicillium samsonianum TaxID=1882272 RepID=UPI002547941F|nr:uncharacterized protein N7471_013996 [Penicillium samsonianum]KAJ6118119.1 hypothetical protein N7471_013996 [Penicillium samsonianum]
MSETKETPWESVSAHAGEKDENYSNVASLLPTHTPRRRNQPPNADGRSKPSGVTRCGLQILTPELRPSCDKSANMV